MTKEVALERLKQNICSTCRCGTENMDNCEISDIWGCNFKALIKILEQDILKQDTKKEIEE